VAAGEPSSPRSLRSRGSSEVEFSRVVAFSDGVFAIAITLLVLALEIPAGLDDLGQQIRDRGDEFFAYGLSFAVIGALWIAHHQFFASLARFDGTLMVLNLVYLAFIALIPFSSSLLGSYAGESAAVITYALNMLAVSVAFTAQNVYAYRAGLLDEAAEAQREGPLVAESFVIPGVFAASIPLALVSPDNTPYLWLLMPLLLRVLGKRREG
jgi:uncharacterized membrane protein